jgi:hypothetical protein
MSDLIAKVTPKGILTLEKSPVTEIVERTQIEGSDDIIVALNLQEGHEAGGGEDGER